MLEGKDVRTKKMNGSRVRPVFVYTFKWKVKGCTLHGSVFKYKHQKLLKLLPKKQQCSWVAKQCSMDLSDGGDDIENCRASICTVLKKMRAISIVDRKDFRVNALYGAESKFLSEQTDI